MINKQFSQPKLLMDSTIICSLEGKRFDFLTSVDTNTLSLQILRLYWKRSTHPKQCDFPKPKKETFIDTISFQMADEINLKKKIDIQKHRLLSCGIFPDLIKSNSIPRSAFNIWAEFMLCFGNPSSKNKRRSSVTFRPSILLFPLLINL